MKRSIKVREESSDFKIVFSVFCLGATLPSQFAIKLPGGSLAPGRRGGQQAVGVRVRETSV